MATASQSRQSAEVPESHPSSNVVVRPRRNRSGPELYFPDETDIKIDGNVFGKERLRWNWWATVDPVTGKKKGDWVPDERHYDIPSNSQYSVYTMPDNYLVQRGRCSKAIRLSLDKGWYRIKIVKSLMGQRNMQHRRAAVGCNWGFSFVAGYDEKEWGSARSLKPQFGRAQMTTDGVRPEYLCGVQGCEEIYVTETALAEHESEAHVRTAPRGE